MGLGLNRPDNVRGLLFLTDDQLRKGIEAMFFAYRGFTADPDRILAEKSYGRAHHRALHFIQRSPGTTVNNLLMTLGVTKQSLNRVLRDLIKAKMIKQIKDDEDTRKKNLFLDKEGKIFFDKIYETQKKRILEERILDERIKHTR